jgi:hypothetical protein
MAEEPRSADDMPTFEASISPRNEQLFLDEPKLREVLRALSILQQAVNWLAGKYRSEIERRSNFELALIARIQGLESQVQLLNEERLKQGWAWVLLRTIGHSIVTLLLALIIRKMWP